MATTGERLKLVRFLVLVEKKTAPPEEDADSILYHSPRSDRGLFVWAKVDLHGREDKSKKWAEFVVRTKREEVNKANEPEVFG
jgi:hypothetical protein